MNWIAYSLLYAMLLMTSGCASLRGEVPRVPSHAIVDGDRTTLGQVFSAQAAQHQGLSGFQVIASGHSPFVARAALADAAELTLDLQYYSVGDDLTTDLLLLRLVVAAERGVRVRILLDDIHASARAFARRATAAHRGIEVRLFNPFYFGGESSLVRLGEFVADSERLNRRMHNKLWVTDNVVAIVGSRNLADAYFDANETGNFSDVDLLTIGSLHEGPAGHRFDVLKTDPSAWTFSLPPTGGRGVGTAPSFTGRGGGWVVFTAAESSEPVTRPTARRSPHKSPSR